MSKSPRPFHFYTEKTRNHDSDSGSYCWPGAVKKNRNDTTSLFPDSCQLLVPNSDM